MPTKYQTIADQLRVEIKAGKYAAATALPSEYVICQEYAASRQTVRQALSLLVQEGLIQRRQGSGSYIRRETPPREAALPTRTVAVVTTYISDYIFPSILREAENVLSAHDCTPILYATQNQVYNERKILAALMGSDVDGILVEGTKTALPNPNLDLYRQLVDKGTPLVFINGNYDKLGGVLSVLDDNYGGGRMLVEYLHGKGHRNIAGIFKSDDIQGHQRYAGYADALRDLGLPVDDRHIFWYDTDDKELHRQRGLPEALFQSLKGCTAAVCYNDEIASHLIVALLRQGVLVPDDLSVVSFDNSQYSDLCPVRITSLSHEDNNVGRLAADMLVRLLRGESCHSLLAPWTLVEKESDSPLKTERP